MDARQGQENARFGYGDDLEKMGETLDKDRKEPNVSPLQGLTWIKMTMGAPIITANPDMIAEKRSIPLASCEK